ncbi:hypothetical protein D3C78_550670 [compost metagenome]
MQVASAELDAADAQGERIGCRLLSFGFAGWQLEQLGEVERAVLGEQHFVAGFVEFDRLQVQGAAPQAVERKVRIQPLKPYLFFARFADLQAPQRQLEAERVELDTLKVRRQCGVLGQLLVGDAQGNARNDEEAKQAVEGHESQQGAEGASQSFVHVSLRLSRQESLEYGRLNRFRWGRGICAHSIPMRLLARCAEPSRMAQRSTGAVRLSPKRIMRCCSGP